jgi:hypothetical protein
VDDDRGVQRLVDAGPSDNVARRTSSMELVYSNQANDDR